MGPLDAFQQGMAEAEPLGIDVIATAYGGNTDFCTSPPAYPCADGHGWGEPDLDHAAELMHQVAARRLALVKVHEAVATDPSSDPEVLSSDIENWTIAFYHKVLSPIGVATGLVISFVCVPFPADRIVPSSRSARAVRHSLTRRSIERN
jgi:hypothetical protein